MDAQNMARLDEFLRAQGFAAALLSNPANITWLTGYAPPIQYGPAPWEGGPALAWLQDGELSLILNDWESGAAAGEGANVIAYSGYTLDGPLLPVQMQTDALAALLADRAGMHGNIAVEMDFLPAAHFEALQAAMPHVTFQHLEGRLAHLRTIKTADEIEKIRAALQLCDAAQDELRKKLHPGASEIELWAEIKGRVEREAGGRTPVLADMVAGSRTGEVGGLPGEYIVQPGDTVLLDFVARRAGFWGDNAASYFTGEPHPELLKAAATARRALQIGREAIRPGIIAGELDALVRGVVTAAGYAPYPHHTGHGLGTTFHEDPRIIPGYPMALAENMVIVLEPGVYLPGIGGVRFEDAYRVTADGSELLTAHLVEIEA